ncbi:MAG: bifunctional acetate--CoA ligase family protein/GNAT family N-acetyltransferase [Salaquimonas sp.]|nr:bifunctional acetate--CoA ligase family protein/GNAT family N-acetyltransferase [Salaquimonas sp.]
MSIRNLDKAFNPASVAIIGGSQREGSVGNVVLKNVIDGGFGGDIWPVNPKYRFTHGLQCYPATAELPAAPDLAVIVTPAQTVPQIVAELGERGGRAAVVLTAGLTRENGLRQKLLDAARPHLFRVIGPNVLGLILPHARLNASFSHMNANPGGLALVSQSGAMVTSIIDWAADKQIGFSSLISLGDQADVDVGDCLDILATDPQTRAILMYLESIPDPSKFMSAARSASRLKPVIAIKAGRHEQAARAAATHTGALAGMDAAVDAALSRAGVLRVEYLEELFDAAEITTRFRPQQHSRLAIVTNGGGAGVLAVDQLGDTSGTLAELSPQTYAALDAALPPTWSHANPIDIIGDAPPERYTAAVAAAAADENVDTILVMNCPTALASPIDAAKAVAGMAEKGKIAGKPVLACWLGDHTARAARAELQKAGIASLETPGDAISAFGFMSSWSRAQAALSRVPESGADDITGQRAVVRRILKAVADEDRKMLTEPEAKAILAAYGIAVPKTMTAADIDEVEKEAEALLGEADNLVVKLLARNVSHKSDIGGVVLNIHTPAEARAAAWGITKRFKEAYPEGMLDGFAIQPMVTRRHAVETILGIARDPVFGPLIMFGAGGTAVEVLRDTAMALPPLDDILARDLIDRTRIGKLLEGYRDVPPADIPAIVAALQGLSQLIVDFPAIQSLDANPVLASSTGIIALDARITIDPARVDEPGPNRDLPIRPWPSQWRRTIHADGLMFDIRPIAPADIRLYPAFFEKVSQEDIRLRFLSPRRHFDDAMLKRLTQIDYEREMAFLALTAGKEEIAGIARLAADPDRLTAEYGILVRSDLQGHGLGKALLELLLEYARVENIGSIEGHVLSENRKMLALCRELGFKIHRMTDEPGVSLVHIDLATGNGRSAAS